jgi:hypothetical protein
MGFPCAVAANKDIDTFTESKIAFFKACKAI